MVKCSICNKEGVYKTSYLSHPEKHDAGLHDLQDKFTSISIHSNGIIDDIFGSDIKNNDDEDETPKNKTKKCKAENDIGDELEKVFGVKKIVEFSKNCQFESEIYTGAIKPEFSFRLKEMVIVVEVDERRHREGPYNTRKEMARPYVYCLKRDRLNENRDLVFIRFSTKSNQEASKDEFKQLIDLIRKLENDPPTKDCIYYINYNKANKHVQEMTKFLKTMDIDLLNFEQGSLFGYLNSTKVIEEHKFRIF